MKIYRSGDVFFIRVPANWHRSDEHGQTPRTRDIFFSRTDPIQQTNPTKYIMELGTGWECYELDEKVLCVVINNLIDKGVLKNVKET